MSPQLLVRGASGRSLAETTTGCGAAPTSKPFGVICADQTKRRYRGHTRTEGALVPGVGAAVVPGARPIRTRAMNTVFSADSRVRPVFYQHSFDGLRGGTLTGQSPKVVCTNRVPCLSPRKRRGRDEERRADVLVLAPETHVSVAGRPTQTNPARPPR